MSCNSMDSVDDVLFEKAFTTSGCDATRENLDQAVPGERDPRDNDRTSKTMEPIQRNPVNFRLHTRKKCREQHSCALANFAVAVCHADKRTCKHHAGGPECWCQLSPGRSPGSRWRVAQLGSPAQHCSRSVATDDNGQFLQEVWMQCSSVIPSSSCCAPGKLQEQFAGFGLPCARWLGHDRHEVDALLRAKSGSV